MYAILAQCPLFRGLTAEQIRETIGERGEFSLTEYKDKDCIAHRDTAYSGLMIILKGRVHGEMVSGGKTIVVDPIEAPQLIAPAFLFGGYNKLPIDVIADGDVTIMTLHRGYIFELMQANVLIMSNFIDIISNRANVWSKKIFFPVVPVAERESRHLPAGTHFRRIRLGTGTRHPRNRRIFRRHAQRAANRTHGTGKETPDPIRSVVDCRTEPQRAAGYSQITTDAAALQLWHLFDKRRDTACRPVQPQSATLGAGTEGHFRQTGPGRWTPGPTSHGSMPLRSANSNKGRPVIEAFRKACPGYKILVTFFSPSGYEIRKNYPRSRLHLFTCRPTPRATCAVSWRSCGLKSPFSSNTNSGSTTCWR